MQEGRQTATKNLARPARMVLCLVLLVVVGAMLHVAHPATAQAYVSGDQIIALSERAEPCELEHAGPAGHCHHGSVCPLCVPVGIAFAMPREASTHPLMAVATLVAGGGVDPRLHPPMPTLQV